MGFNLGVYSDPDIYDIPFVYTCFDPNLLLEFNYLIRQFVENSDYEVYSRESLVGIADLNRLLVQNMMGLNWSIFHKLIVSAATQARGILEVLIDFYYIFEFPDKWNRRSSAYYFSKFQKIRQLWLVNSRMFDFKPSTTELDELNRFCHGFFNSFQNNELPKYVKYHLFTVQSWKYNDYLFEYPWNNDSRFQIKTTNWNLRRYSMRQFMIDQGLQDTYNFLYTSLSQYLHNSSNVPFGKMKSSTMNEINYSSRFVYYFEWTLGLMALSILVLDRLLNCVSTDNRRTNKEVMLNDFYIHVQFIKNYIFDMYDFTNTQKYLDILSHKEFNSNANSN